MLFLDEIKDITKESEIYKHILKIMDNLEKTINVQYAKRGTLTQILDEIANIDEIQVEDTQGLLSVIEDIRNILSRINDNIEGVKKLLEDITGIHDRLDNIIDHNMEDELLYKDIEFFYILYIEKTNIIEDTNLAYESIIMKSYEFVFLLVSKLNDEKKSKEIIDKLVNSENILDLKQESEDIKKHLFEVDDKQEKDKDNKVQENIDVFKSFKFESEMDNKVEKLSQNEKKIEEIAEIKEEKHNQGDEESKQDCVITKNQEKGIKKGIQPNQIQDDKKAVAKTNKSSIKKEELNVKDNNVLIISQIQNKVFLPYKVEDIKRKYKEGHKQFSSIQDIISSEYVVSLNKYKNPVVARFKEAYNLMRKKEDATFSEALDLALEVTFKSNLNPAVITACNNLNELDKYLDCLEADSLDKFNIFKVEFEGLPSIK